MARPDDESPWQSLRHAFDVVARADAGDGTTPLPDLLDRAMGTVQGIKADHPRAAP